MPKYHKTTKIELWRTSDSYQDSVGAWHEGRSSHVADLWANIKGKDYTTLYQATGVWAKPIIDATVTRGKFTSPRIGDHIRYEGSFYAIKAVNELTGQVGHDMRITCELDEGFKRP